MPFKAEMNSLRLAAAAHHDKTEAARLTRELIRNDPGRIEGRTLTVKKARPMAKHDNFGRSGRDDRSGGWNQW
jgi:hypothetical protein